MKNLVGEAVAWHDAGKFKYTAFIFCMVIYQHEVWSVNTVEPV